MIYLVTRPETAAERAAPGGTRPVLMGEDPVARMRQLLTEREPFYRTAHAAVDSDRKTPPQVASEVVRLAQSSAGW
jgi:shikimate kinase